MELVLRGRRVRHTEQLRELAEHKLHKIDRLLHEPARLEVTILGHPTPRIEGGRRVKVTCSTPWRTYRAEGTGHDVLVALDQVVRRLERQIESRRGKLHDRWTGRGDRLQSARTSPEAAGGSK